MNPLGGVDLLAPGLAERLIDQPARYPTLGGDMNCNRETPELLVSSVDQSRSLLLTKLNGEHDCGAAMPIPRQANYLSEDDIACISSYIAAIVSENGASDGEMAAGGNGGGSSIMTNNNAGSGGASQ